MAIWHVGVCGCKVCKNLKLDLNKKELICLYLNEEFNEVEISKCINFNK